MLAYQQAWGKGDEINPAPVGVYIYIIMLYIYKCMLYIYTCIFKLGPAKTLYQWIVKVHRVHFINMNR